MRPRILIVSPALAADNNGNWQTAWRWSNFLRGQYDVDVARGWDGAPADAMIALHARRSASPLARFAATGRPVALVLTGTDLYRDIRTDASAQRSLELAARLVVLQERGPDELPGHLRGKTETIFQSARRLRPGRPRTRSFDLLLVGHLRAEKDPLTALRALARLPAPQAPYNRLRLLHVGSDRDPETGAAFRREAAGDPRIRLLGPLPHARTRQLIRRGRVLLLPSLMEGGANVLIEAVTAGVPVLGSRIPGSVGMLGRDYDGWFDAGDDAALAALIARCQREPEFLEHLRRQCALRAPLFDPAREQAAVRRLAHNLLAPESRQGAASRAPASNPDPS
ncbi:MAG TPA: selenoneine biosynthesis selenosugar synthase SenB [Quisquiliibacterium sp.]|nr:selenoneine biosynthesis selenosugar synthase SenB [Quisquiliibacterium sp.]